MFCCSIETYIQTIDARIEEYRLKYPNMFDQESDEKKNN